MQKTTINSKNTPNIAFEFIFSPFFLSTIFVDKNVDKSGEKVWGRVYNEIMTIIRLDVSHSVGDKMELI